MKSWQILIIAAAVLFISGIVVIVALIPAGSVSSSSSGGSPTPLPAVEVRSYKGTALSSVNDFRENSIRGPQDINISDYRLIVTGLTNRTVVYTYDEVLEYPRYTKVVTLFCVEGWDATILWEGILIRDLIRNAGPDPHATTVVFTAHDGYTTSLPLDYLTSRDILMAYRMNNITLPVERGYPFALVAEDKWGYKWIRWIEKIELTGNSDYLGYWEQRGYSDTADLNQSFFS